MLPVYAPNGLRIVGTFDRLPCRADVFGFTQEVDGTLIPEFTGFTTVFWDDQEFTRDRKGEVIYLDEEGNQWPLSACEVGEDDGEPSPNG